MKENIEDFLSNIFSQPEADSFIMYMKIGDVDKVREILAERSIDDEKTVSEIFKYFNDLFHKKIKLTEVFKVEYENLKENDNVLVCFAGNVFKSILRKTIIKNEEKIAFYDSNSSIYIEVKHANQIWKIE